MRQSVYINKLNAFFSEQKKEAFIKLAYLFGSRANTAEGPVSDYDIALLYSKLQPFALRYKLAHQLAAILSANHVDLVVLNDAPIELRYSVIATGIVVYEESFEERVEYEALTLSLYGDYLPVLRNQRDAILEECNDEAGIQRYRAALGKTQRLLKKIRAI